MISLVYGYLIIVVFLVLTGCGLPVPEEAFIIAAGIAASAGELYAPLAYAACLVGALLGDLVMYGVGRYFGHGLRRGWLANLLNGENEARAERMIKLHGLKAFFVGRFLVGVRAPMYIAAGILRMPVTRFLFYDGICATVVISVVFGLSWYYGEPILAIWEQIHASEKALTLSIVAIGAVVGLYFLWLYHRHKVHVAAAAAVAAADQTPSPAPDLPQQPPGELGELLQSSRQ